MPRQSNDKYGPAPFRPVRATDAFELNRKLGRGVNVLGYDPVWKSREKARMKDHHFALIKEAGFNSVRVNLHPLRDGGMTPEGRLAGYWLSVLDWAVERSLEEGLAVVLDFHEFTAMGRAPLELKDKFLAFWRQIGVRYSGYPETVLFELLNEPHGQLTPELWNRFLREALEVVRRSNPDRVVVIGPANWNSIHYLEKLDLPPEDRQIIATVHYYEPFQFTHQGAKWAGLEGKVGVEWRGTEEEKRKIVEDFGKAQAWAETHRRPIFLGEFGVYDKAPMDSRTRYLNFVARLAESLGWSWAYWQFDSDFILYDINSEQWVEPVLKALIPSGSP